MSAVGMTIEAVSATKEVRMQRWPRVASSIDPRRIEINALREGVGKPGCNKDLSKNGALLSKRQYLYCGETSSHQCPAWTLTRFAGGYSV